MIELIVLIWVVLIIFLILCLIFRVSLDWTRDGWLLLWYTVKEDETIHRKFKRLHKFRSR